MKSFQSLLVGVFAITSLCAVGASPSSTTPAPLIERSKIFGNPTRSGASLSPNGRWLSWLAPREDVMNLWVAPGANLADAGPLTSSKDRPVRLSYWAPDSSMVMYMQDTGGDENFLLYGIDVVTGVEKTLTPFEKTRVQIVNVSPLVKDRILVGLTFTPTTFACGVDIVGPSNLETLSKTIPPYWTALIQQLHRRMGNPETPAGIALLKERSPVYKAGNIIRPLLIGQGANDPRVNQAESDQIVSAMQRKGIPVTYVLFPDEGHGFARPENNIAFNAISENFLASCLGGRAEPIGSTVKSSSARVPVGAAFTPGLEASLKE